MEEQGGPRSHRLTVIALIVTVLAGIVVPIALNWWCPPFVATCSQGASAQILSPSFAVDHAQQVTGTSAGVPEEDALWVVLYVRAVDRYYPADLPATIAADGSWSSRLLVGHEDEVGLVGEIFVVSANPQAQAEFRAYLERSLTEGFVGMMGLPAGTRVLDRIAVTRR